jgi:flavodoxin
MQIRYPKWAGITIEIMRRATMREQKCLIAYFSRAGNNYINENIVNLPIGNTEQAAKMIVKHTGGELFRIDTIKKYPADYHKATDIAKQELNSNARPELTERVDSMAEYDIIYLGYPNWWGTMPMAVFSFLEEYDFSGKTIIPFCTHEGSGMGRSESDIRKLCPNAQVLKGLPIKGSHIQRAENEIADWIKKMGTSER